MKKLFKKAVPIFVDPKDESLGKDILRQNKVNTFARTGIRYFDGVTALYTAAITIAVCLFVVFVLN